MKTQGFTLIELLAVIVILAIIALIATPIVLGIIDDAKESAQLRSAEMYLKGVENAVMRENMNSGGNFRPNLCTISSEGNLDCEGKDGIIEVEVNGEKPKNGNIVFENGKIKEVTLTYQSGTIVKNDEGNLVYSDEQSGSGSDEEEILVAGLYDDDGNQVYTWQQLLDTGLVNVNDNVLTTMTETEKHQETIELLTGKLVIDNSVIYIGDYAFSWCDTIKEIIIPNSVISIGDFAFNYCYTATSIKVPDSVTYIGENAFANFESLTSINIPNSITTINNSTFYYSTNLTSITIPDSVTSIGDSAFEGVAINSLTIPGNVKSIGDYAFQYAGLTSLIIEDGVEYIGSGAFLECRQLETVKIANSVTNIGGSAFGYCESLTSIEMPNSMTNLGAAFHDCTNLTSITIPNGITKIEFNAFRDCTSLTSITMPNSIQNIDEFAFGRCRNLTTINFNGTKDQWNNIILFNSTSYSKWNQYCQEITVHCTDGDIVIPATA